MQNTQKKKRSRLAILVAFLVIMINLAVFGASAGLDGLYPIEDDYTTKPAIGEIQSGSELLPDMDYCAFWIAPTFDVVSELNINPELIATGVGRVVYSLYDEQTERHDIYSLMLPLGIDSMRVHVVSDGYWIYDSNDNTNVLLELPVTSYLYIYPILSDADSFWVIDMDGFDTVAWDFWDHGVSLEYGWKSYAVGVQYTYDIAKNIIQSEYDRGLSEGYERGYEQGYEDFGESPNTLLEFIAAIFSAPGYLINTIFDFEIFGINMANAFRVILTLAVVGLVVMFAIKHGGA